MAPTTQGLPSLRDNAGASTTYTGDRPGGVVSGEHAIAQVMVRTASVTISGVPTGWELVAKIMDSAVANTLFVYIKKLTTSEPTTYGWTGDKSAESSVTIQRVSGAFNGPSALDALSGTPTTFFDSTDDKTVVFPSVTTAHADTLVMCIGQNGGAMSISGWSGGLTELWDGSASGTGVARTYYGSSVVKAESGATGTFTGTLTNTVVALTATLALRPETTSTKTLNQSLVATSVPSSRIIKHMRITKASPIALAAITNKQVRKNMNSLLSGTATMWKQAMTRITATASSTSSIRKHATKIHQVLSTNAADVQKGVSTTVRSNLTPTTAVQKSTTKRMPVSTSVISTLSKLPVIRMVATIANNLTIRRHIASNIKATAGVQATAIKGISKNILVNSTVFGFIDIDRILVVTLSALTSGQASMKKLSNIYRSTHTTVDATMSKRPGIHLKSAVSALTERMQKRVVKHMRHDTSVSATVVKAASKLMGTDVSTLASITKAVTTRLGSLITSVPTITKLTTKQLNAVIASTASIDRLKLFLMYMMATIQPVATTSRSIGKKLLVAAVPKGSIRKAIAKYVGTDVAASTSMRKNINKQLDGMTNTLGVVRKNISKRFRAPVTPLPTSTKEVSTRLEATVASFASTFKSVVKRLSTISESDAYLVKSITIRLTSSLLASARVAIEQIFADTTRFVESIISVSVKPKYMIMVETVKPLIESVITVAARPKEVITVTIGQVKYVLTIQILPKPTIRIEKR